MKTYNTETHRYISKIINILRCRCDVIDVENEQIDVVRSTSYEHAFTQVEIFRREQTCIFGFIFRT